MHLSLSVRVLRSRMFAAGDAQAGSTKQLVPAAGEGATAALMICDYLSRT